jgi:predicted aldo/keto reductase-like oxidoreductase
LDKSESPFEAAMTVPQCIHYCLTRPAVATVLVGAKTPEQISQSAEYSDLPLKLKEYANVLGNAPAHRFSDKCMYCGHCAPCSVGIDIASVNKYADLCAAQGMVPETVRNHYDLLRYKASDCISCGLCETNCPFGVEIIDHMLKAKGIFGK